MFNLGQKEEFYHLLIIIIINMYSDTAIEMSGKMTQNQSDKMKSILERES